MRSLLLAIAALALVSSPAAAQKNDRTFVAGGDINVTDRPSRLLGQVSFIAPQHIICDTGCEDVTDRPGRQLGQADITDRSARLLGEVSFIAPQHIICDSGCAGSGGGGSGGVVDQGAAGSSPWAVSFLTPQHVIVDSAPTTAVTNSNLDIALSALRDALRGASSKTLTDVVNALTGIVATAANQTTANASLSSIDGKLTSEATGAKQDTGNASLSTIATNTATATSDPTSTAAGVLVRATPQEHYGTGGLTMVGDIVYADGAGYNSVGGSIFSGTFSGTVAPVVSDDHITWTTGAFVGPSGTQVTSLALTNPSSAQHVEFFTSGQSRYYGVKVTSFTSGSLTAQVTASTRTSTLALSPASGLNGLAAPLYRTAVGGVDGSNVLRSFTMLNSAPAGTEYGVVTRPIAPTTWPLSTNAAQETGGNLATLAGKDFSTGAKQDTGNTSLAAAAVSLASLDGKAVAQAAATATSTFVPGATIETTVLAANGSRKAFTVVNQSSKSMLLKFGTGIGSSSYTALIPPFQQFSVGMNGPAVYTGVVTGIWFGIDGGGAAVSEL